MFRDGLKNPSEHGGGITEFLPSTDTEGERKFVHDSSTPETLSLFDDDFYLLLAGLLMDGQPMLIREDNML